MKYAITITEMTENDVAALSSFLISRGAEPATPSNGKGRQAVNELAIAVGATPSAPPAPFGADPFTAPAAQTPPPPPTASTSTPTVLGTSTVPGELDSRGVPHNLQFHADSKRQNKNGSWARRKGVDAAACDAWEAQFAPIAPAAPTPPPAPVAAPTAPTPQPTTAEINAKFAPGLPPQGHTVQVNGDPFAAPAAPPAPPAAVAPPAPPAPVAEPLPDVAYATWHALYTNLLTAGKMTPDAYTAIAERHGAIEDQMKFYNDPEARARSYREMELLAAA